MELKIQHLKGLYEKDFLLWLEENLKLLENREYDLVDWENLLEEIRDMGQRHLDAVISQMAGLWSTSISGKNTDTESTWEIVG